MDKTVIKIPILIKRSRETAPSNHLSHSRNKSSRAGSTSSTPFRGSGKFHVWPVLFGFLGRLPVASSPWSHLKDLKEEKASFWKLLIFIAHVLWIWVWEPRDWEVSVAVPGLIASFRVYQEKHLPQKMSRCQFSCLWSDSKGKDQWGIIGDSSRRWSGNFLLLQKTLWLSLFCPHPQLLA